MQNELSTEYYNRLETLLGRANGKKPPNTELELKEFYYLSLTSPGISDDCRVLKTKYMKKRAQADAKGFAYEHGQHTAINKQLLQVDDRCLYFYFAVYRDH